ncbi:hypothetical protein [Winogradskyella marincola]|uniref:Anti-sigma factor n=1 Tax=Winogradskyella marincola TaxID=3037795 RepID=A0ABT6G177_9FLAO|nr:hypothetical protein [Winogradskyella sp. YYF002]MDG4715797.1 hypothetical protein [Winogradskyella sp. YYF002]
MAPIKFEEQIKDKLEKRSLQPSAESWAKLTERLEADEKKSKNPWFWWMGIAAAVIITLVVVVQTLGSKDTEEILPQVVEQEKKEDANKVEEALIIDIKETEMVSQNNEDKKSSASKNEIENKPENINYKLVSKSNTKTQLVVDEKLMQKDKSSVEDSNNDIKLITEKVTIDKEAFNEAMTEVLNEIKPNTTITDREVDSLLKVASKELFKDKLQDDARRTVDANSLLQEVEDEMGESFRTKVYEVLKDGYKTVKTAVAQRND